MGRDQELFHRISEAFSSVDGFNCHYRVKNGAIDITRKKGNFQYWIHLSFSPLLESFHQVNPYIYDFRVKKITQKLFPDFTERDIILLKDGDLLNSEWRNEMKEFSSYSLFQQQEITEFIDALVRYFQIYIVPFFNRFPDLDSINNKVLNEVSEKDYRHYIPGEKNFKVLIIMKLCKNPRYSTFKQWALGTYERARNLDEKKYGKSHERLIDLLHYLDTEPSLN